MPTCSRSSREYLNRLDERVRAFAPSAPLRIMVSSGGFTSAKAAAETPILLFESGPAGGVLSALNTARNAVFDRILAFDMGGTTAKACVAVDNEPLIAHSFECARVSRFARYVQYAHARIASVVRFAEERGVAERADADLSKLTAPEERVLMLLLLHFPGVVAGAAEAREPHRLTAYAQELATAFHQFYHVCRIVGDDAELSSARLELARATRTVLKNTLQLLGVSAPSSM